MPLAGDYRAALLALARALEMYAHETGGTAVLVGGAATAIYTDGAHPSNDFDVVAGDDVALDAAMRAAGWVPEDRAGRLRIGWWHPAHPRYGAQQVSGALYDGRSDAARLLRMEVAEDGAAVTLPPVEDLIADRLAQHAVASPTDDSRLLQARDLFGMTRGLDLAYLRRRVREEGGDPALLGL